MWGRVLLTFCLVGLGMAAYLLGVQRLARVEGRNGLYQPPPGTGGVDTPPNDAYSQHRQQSGLAQSAREHDARPRINSRHGVVQVRFHSVIEPTADAPLRGLLIAEARYPHSDLFRLTWKQYGYKPGSKSAVLYDRRARTLRFWCRGFDRGTFFRRTVFTGVTDAALRREAQSYDRPDAPSLESETVALAFFDDLTRQGCAAADRPPASRSGWEWRDGVWRQAT